MTDADRERLAKLIEDRRSDVVQASEGLPGYEALMMKSVYEDCARIIREQPAESPWIGVQERLPEPGRKYLLYSMLTFGSAVGMMCKDGFFRDDDGTKIFTTHWMPLPPPPHVE